MFGKCVLRTETSAVSTSVIALAAGWVTANGGVIFAPTDVEVLNNCRTQLAAEMRRRKRPSCGCPVNMKNLLQVLSRRGPLGQGGPFVPGVIASATETDGMLHIQWAKDFRLIFERQSPILDDQTSATQEQLAVQDRPRARAVGIKLVCPHCNTPSLECKAPSPETTMPQP